MEISTTCGRPRMVSLLSGWSSSDGLNALRQVRDAGMAKVMADPRLQPEVMPMPFDGKRMIFGGFVPIVQA